MQAFFFESFGDLKRQLQCLTRVKAWIAVGVIAVFQILFGDLFGTTHAFGDILSRHFKVDPTGMGAFRTMDIEEGADFGSNRIKVPGLVASGALHRVGVHGIGGPHDALAFALDGLDERR